MKRNNLLLLVLLVALSLLCGLTQGCAVVRYQTKDVKMTYIVPAFGNRVLANVDLQKGTLGNSQVQQEQMSQAIGVGIATAMKHLYGPTP